MGTTLFSYFVIQLQILQHLQRAMHVSKDGIVQGKHPARILQWLMCFCFFVNDLSTVHSYGILP